MAKTNQVQMLDSCCGGVDGCRGGWLVVIVCGNEPYTLQSAAIVPTFEVVLKLTHHCGVVAVDIPIGLADTAEPGGRAADRAARNLLKPTLASSVFPTPPRAVLKAQTYAQAVDLCKSNSRPGQSLSRQAFAIVPKMREVDDAIGPEIQQRVVETHPELCFRALNGARTLEWNKHGAAGVLARLRLLSGVGLGVVAEQVAAAVGTDAKIDDILDATAAAWTASRVALGHAVRVPDHPELDARGLRMEMWY